VVCLRDMFDVAWIERMQGAVDNAIANPGPMHLKLDQGMAGKFHGDSFVWTWQDDFRAFMFESPAAHIAQQVLGATERVTLFFDTLLVKEPGSQAVTPWHHDQPYWPIEGNQVCTIWTPFDPVTVESGAVEYLVGSHCWGKRYQPQSFTGDNRYGTSMEPLPDIEAQRDQHKFVIYETEPGDCVVHHGLTLHRAPGNANASVRRRALASRFCGDDATYRPEGSFQPLIRDPGIESGAPLECGLFPRVWSPDPIAPD
jgi:ectoine hydroxylase-related dioxygenase (phytanoyl-CoA dioxygenase family)